MLPHLAFVRPARSKRGYDLFIRGETRGHWYFQESAAISYAFALFRDNGGGRIWIMDSSGYPVVSETVIGQPWKDPGFGGSRPLGLAVGDPWTWKIPPE
jgi:hypothetical protein